MTVKWRNLNFCHDTSMSLRKILRDPMHVSCHVSLWMHWLAPQASGLSLSRATADVETHVVDPMRILEAVAREINMTTQI